MSYRGAVTEGSLEEVTEVHPCLEGTSETSDWPALGTWVPPPWGMPLKHCPSQRGLICGTAPTRVWCPAGAAYRVLPTLGLSQFLQVMTPISCSRDARIVPGTFPALFLGVFARHRVCGHED